MNKIYTILISLGFLAALIQCEPLSKEETYALNRDGLSRANPNELLYGFFPAWPVVLYLIAGSFAVIAVISFFGYVTGLCRNKNQQYTTAVRFDN